MISFEPGDDGGVGGWAAGKENGRNDVSSDESGGGAGVEEVFDPEFSRLLQNS
jgi:hypothetical protein